VKGTLTLRLGHPEGSDQIHYGNTGYRYPLSLP
jgi:hypothetical protein